MPSTAAIITSVGSAPPGKSWALQTDLLASSCTITYDEKLRGNPVAV